MTFDEAVTLAYADIPVRIAGWVNPDQAMMLGPDGALVLVDMSEGQVDSPYEETEAEMNSTEWEVYRG